MDEHAHDADRRQPTSNGGTREQSDFEKERIERLRRAMYSRTVSGKLGVRPRRRLGELSSKVGEDWVRPEIELSQTTVAPALIRAPRRILYGVLFAAVAFFVTSLGVFTYFFLFGEGSSPASPANIDIRVSGPTQVSGGDPTELQVVVVNRNPIAIELADLVITFPDGTRAPGDLSSSFETFRHSLGTIEPGGRRQGTVTAVFSGSEGEKGIVHVELEYRLRNSSSIFVAKSDYVLTFVSSPISMALTANNETVSGQPVSFTVSIGSNSTTVIRDVVLAVDIPFGFKYNATNPQPASEGFWELGDVRPGERKEITFTGTLQGQNSDERVFRLSAGLRESPQDKKIAVRLADFEQHIVISEPFLALAVAVNKEGGQTAVIGAPGSTVNIVINYENTLKTAITDAVVVASLGGIEIDGETVRSSDGTYRSVDRAMFWDKNTTRSALGNIPPGTKGTVNFSFQLPSSDTLGNARNPQIDIAVHATGKRVGESSVPETLQSSATRTIKLASAVDIAAQGVYYANPFGSTGPLPPQANVETTYALVFTLKNTSNKIKDAKIVATLPTYVRWLGVYSPKQEKFVFNRNDSTVTWHIGDLAEGVGAASTTPRQLAFKVGFTPSTSQVGQQPPLLTNIIFAGLDTFTGKTITNSKSYAETIATSTDSLKNSISVSLEPIPDITTNLTSSDPGFTADKASVVR